MEETLWLILITACPMIIIAKTGRKLDIYVCIALFRKWNAMSVTEYWAGWYPRGPLKSIEITVLCHLLTHSVNIHFLLWRPKFA